MGWKWEIAVSIGISHHKGVPYFLNGFYFLKCFDLHIYIRWENVLACTVKTIYGAWYLTLEYTQTIYTQGTIYWPDLYSRNQGSCS